MLTTENQFLLCHTFICPFQPWLHHSLSSTGQYMHKLVSWQASIVSWFLVSMATNMFCQAVSLECGHTGVGNISQCTQFCKISLTFRETALGSKMIKFIPIGRCKDHWTMEFGAIRSLKHYLQFTSSPTSFGTLPFSQQPSS